MGVKTSPNWNFATSHLKKIPCTVQIYMYLINIASLVLFISSASYCLIEGIAMFNGSNQTAAETVCVVFSRISIAAITLGISLFILWLTQRVIYANSKLKLLNKEYVSVFSFVVLILWILFWISILTSYYTKEQSNLNKKKWLYILDKNSVQLFNEMMFT